MDLKQLRRDTIDYFSMSGIDPDDAVVEVDLMIENILGFTPKDLLIEHQREVSKELYNKFQIIMDTRVMEKTPIQYLLGFTYFYGLKLLVNRHVLIPRRDTETLVDYVVDRYKAKNFSLLADVGVGSGNISLAILKHCPMPIVLATDISAEAIEVAKHNADVLGLADRLTFYNTDILERINITLDGVVSNPPYIPQEELETLDEQVSKFEPHLALFSPSKDPVVNYRKLSSQGFERVRSGGFIALETHYNYADEVKDILAADGWKNITIVKDLSGHPRLVTADHP